MNFKTLYSQYIPNKLNNAQWAKIIEFYSFLKTEAMPLGFIGESDAQTLFERHILDSLLVFTANKAKVKLLSASSIADMGTGAGLPGVILSILLPDVNVIALDSNRRRLSFVENVQSTLQAGNLKVKTLTIGEQPPDTKVDLVVMRAFLKPLIGFELALHLLQPSGTIIYWRANELEPFDSVQARIKDLGYHATHEVVPSPSNLGKRGFYTLTRENEAIGFPRRLAAIKKDKLCAEIL